MTGVLTAQNFRLPGASDRITIIGRTGTGKTTAAKWLLSRANWHRRPWVVIDYKRQDFNDIPGADFLPMGRAVPRRAGIYVVQPLPTKEDDERIEELLWRIWNRGKIGILIDEGYLTPNKEAFPALLVSGRSKQIPMIMNTQRPVWLPPHVWSESGFFMIYALNRRTDQRSVEEFAPFDLTQDIPPYHSRWYDVARDTAGILRPVPDHDSVIELFRERGADRHRGFSWSEFTSPGPSKTGSRWF